MAFHPFQFFRKRQKSFLAVLTILTMFIFILTGFSGSIVDRASSWFGAGARGDKTEVTQVNGKTITVAEVLQVQQNRRMANAFMVNAVATSTQPSMSSLDPAVRARLSGMLSMMQLGGFAMLRQQIRSYQQELLKEGNDKAAAQVGNINRGLGLDEWRMNHPGELYFGGTLTADSLLDFLIWRQQADKLGITLTDDDVRKAVNQEAGGEVLTGTAAKDAEKMRLLLQGIPLRDVSTRDLYAALRDELRVRLAQEALLGDSGGARAALGTGLAGDQGPATSTPEQFWDFYKDNRTTLKVDFLKVPVGQFTDEVKETPTEQELEDYFKRYKNEEPNPERATPGFRVPRKVKVEWVAADPESAHYREAAAKALPLMPAGAALGVLSLPGSFAATSGGPAGALGTVWSLALAPQWYDPLRLEYESYAKGVRSWWDASNIEADNDNPYASGLRRPDTVAAVVGQAVGAAATGAPPWTARLTLAGCVEARLAEQKVHQANMVLAGASQFPLAVLAQEAAAANVRVPPLDAVRDDLTARLRDRIAPELARAALDAFVKELKAKATTPKEAAEFVAKNANLEHGITGHGATPQALSQAEIADAPALAPLKRAEEGLVPLNLAGARRFAAEFFGLKQPYQPTELRNLPTVSPTRYYYWLSEDTKPYEPKFAEARPRVEAAWKFDKARDLAKKKAEQIVEAIKQRGEGISADRFLRDEAERLKYERFEPTTPIAKLVRPLTPTLRAGFSMQYEPYKFEESKIAYPQPDTVAKLFKALNKPGDATVIRDAPGRNYYVAVLDERKVPTEKEFLDSYQGAALRVISDGLWARFQAEREERYRADLMRQLREEAKVPLDDQGKYKIDPEVRRRLGGGFGGEE
jgi:hypothetical protein